MKSNIVHGANGGFTMGVNREMQKKIDKDIKENEELYQALADTPDEDEDAKDEWRKVEKKPVEVEYRGPYFETDEIETIEGDFEVDEEYLDEHGGYVIIKGVQGEVYPCALDVFRKTYRQSDNIEAILRSQSVSKGGKRNE